MADNEKNVNISPEVENNEHVSTSQALSDEQRVKVMSPSMLVLKRFIRNRLAVVGLCILAAMFLFSFIGPLFVPYEETQVFDGLEVISKDFAQYQDAKTWTFTVLENSGMTVAAANNAIRAINNGETEYTFGDVNYVIKSNSDRYCVISAPVELATITSLQGTMGELIATEGADIEITEELKEAMIDAIENAEEGAAMELKYEGVDYLVRIKSSKRGEIVYSLCAYDDACVGRKVWFNDADPEQENLTKTFEFTYGAMEAYHGSATSFTADGKSYKAEKNGDFVDIYSGSDIVCRITEYVLQAKGGEFIDLETNEAIHNKVKEMGKVAGGKTESVVVGEGEDAIEYTIQRDNLLYTIKSMQEQKIIQIFSAPSADHWLGTDKTGMDVLTRLMYGGQVSLMVGFVVVIIELLIGVILGGISGYFSGWVDVIIMRIIELFNCIPYYPMLMIIGSVMDQAQVSAQARIYLLMVILGALSWTGIARIVRGQILSLREQDFIIATEACGIPVSRRITKHLIPNVIPLLIVQATMGLGGIIITEATLSFLGLGVKYPLASWGSIIQQASDPHVMTNYWWIWLPAGMLILLTVLGFNFVGDGLRDAFDPKMKR